jgi:hypothetical protein
MEATKEMIVAFAKAAQQGTLDRVTWNQNGCYMSACLEEGTLAGSTLLLTYQLYSETEHTVDFTISVDVSMTLRYDEFLKL